MSTKDQIIAQAAAGYADDAPSVRLALGKVARRLAVRIDEDLALINRRVAKPFLRALGPVGNLALGAAGAAAATGVLAPAAAIVAIGAISFYGVGNALRNEDRFELLSQVKAQLDAAGEPTPTALADALQGPDRTLPRASERIAGFWKLVSAAASLGLQAANEKAAQARQSVVGAVVGAKDAAVTRVSGAAASAASSALRKKDAAVAAVDRAIAPAVGFFRAVANRVHAISAGVQEGVRTYRELSGKPAAAAAGEAAAQPCVEPRAEPSASEPALAWGGTVDFLLPLGEPAALDNRVIAANWELVNEYVPRLTMRPSLDAILAPSLHQRFPLVPDVVVDVEVRPAAQPQSGPTPVVVEAAPATAAAPEAPKVIEQPAPAKKKLSFAERMRAAAAEPELVASNDFDDMPGPEDFPTPSQTPVAAQSVQPASTNPFDDEFGAPPGMDDEPTPASRAKSAALAF